MRIYLAGPLFTTAERDFNSALAFALRRHGHDVWLPQDNEPRERTAQAIFRADVDGVDWCEVVFANMDGPDPDSGTAWECGYGFARGKQIIVFRTDMRGISDGGLAPFNLMLAASAHAVIAPGEPVGVETLADLFDHEIAEIVRP